VPYRPVAEPRDARYPFALNTGRLRDQWHGMSRSGRVPALWAHEPEPVAELHPQELARLRVHEGQLVRLRSRRGELLLPARASTSLGPAQVHVAMHWGAEVMAGGVNRLTSPARCPTSRQPELKHAAVAVEAVTAETLPWRLVAAAWLRDEADALRARAALAACTGWAPYAVLVPFGPAPGAAAGTATHGLLLRLAAPAPLAGAALDTVAQALGFDVDGVLRYDDPRRHQQRRVRLAGHPHPSLQALLLAGDVTAASWLLPLLQSAAPVPEGLPAPALLAPLPRPPVAVPAPDRALCNCLGVGRMRIESVLARTVGAPAQRLLALQRELGCGTQCGSCLPELRRLAASVAEPA
jgi:assimilatory nitrate reductase catalytic subunit